LSPDKRRSFRWKLRVWAESRPAVVSRHPALPAKSTFPSSAHPFIYKAPRCPCPPGFCNAVLTAEPNPFRGTSRLNACSESPKRYRLQIESGYGMRAR
jgi:hypothetical protein